MRSAYILLLYSIRNSYYCTCSRATPLAQADDEQKETPLMLGRQRKRGHDDATVEALQYALQAPQSMCRSAGSMDAAAACVTHGRRVALKVWLCLYG